MDVETVTPGPGGAEGDGCDVWIESDAAGAEPEPIGDGSGAAVRGSAIDLDRAEAMRLLARAPCGRVVFTRDALPAIRPVRHIVRDDRIIVLVRLVCRSTDLACARDRVVVAYEADDLDPSGRRGWAVVVTGPAHTITDPDLIARYEPMLRSGLDRAGDVVVAIEPSIVTGVTLRGGR